MIRSFFRHLTPSCQSGGKAIALLALLGGAVAQAQTVNWAHSQIGFASGGSVTVRSLSSTAYTAVQNPSGMVAKANQNAATQPATVVVQATASLPIKNAGDTCTSSTSGTSPNQVAAEGTAITSDRTSLLTCQGGAWTKQNANGAVAAMYLDQAWYYTASYPPNCPSGFTEVGFSPTADGFGSYTVSRRVCMPNSSTTKHFTLDVAYCGSCSLTMPSCPSGWATAASIANSGGTVSGVFIARTYCYTL